jgi:zinc transport system ATP-binding protein
LSEPVITFEDVSFAYNGGLVLDRVNLSIEPKEFVWIVGPNGGGKTTLVKLLLGLLSPRRGKVRVFGRAPAAVRPRLGYMPQHARLDPKFPVTVLDVALMGRIGSGVRLGRYNRSDKKAALVALDQVGLADFRDRALDELSGGQQRRLLIARALASEPEMLVLDEPMANLDVQVEADLNRLLRRLNERLTIVMVSHDPAFVSGYVERVVCVKTQVHVHPTSRMDSDFIRELYGAPVRLVRHDVHDQGCCEDDTEAKS